MRANWAITSVWVGFALSACFGGGGGGGAGDDEGASNAASNAAGVLEPGTFRSQFVDENACLDFSPCESDYNGTWEWTGVTFCEDISDQLNPMITEPACQDALVGLSLDQGGTVVIQEEGDGCLGTGEVNASLTVTARIEFTQRCAIALGLQGDLSAGCSELSRGFMESVTEEMTMGECKLQGTSCVCDLHTPTIEVFREGQCNPNVPDFSCVQGDVWTLHSGLAESGLDFVIELTRRGGGASSGDPSEGSAPNEAQ